MVHHQADGPPAALDRDGVALLATLPHERRGGSEEFIEATLHPRMLTWAYFADAARDGRATVSYAPVRLARLTR